MNKGPNSAQKYIQLLEAALESFPQTIVQLFYFIKLDFNVTGNLLVLFSLVFSGLLTLNLYSSFLYVSMFIAVPFVFVC